MSNAITDAVIAGIASDLNPMNAATADYVKESIVKLKASNIQLKLDLQLRVQQLLEEAGDNARPSVLKAYEDMLQKVVTL